MKVCKQAEHCAYIARLIADRCCERMALEDAHKTDPSTGVYSTIGWCLSDKQLRDQIAAARRELTVLDKAIESGMW